MPNLRRLPERWWGPEGRREGTRSEQYLRNQGEGGIDVTHARKRKSLCRALLLSALMALAIGSFAGAQEVVNITYMSWFTGDFEALEQPILDWFNEEHPQIQVEKIAVNWGEYTDQLYTMIAAGMPPDVVALDTWWSHDFFNSGAILPIDTFVERDQFDLNRFRSGFVEEAIGYFDGRLYGLPWAPGTIVMFYNESLFDRNGLPYPTYDWTTDEFIDYGMKITNDQNGDGVNDVFGTDHLAYWNWTASFGGDYVDRATGRQTMTTQEFIDGMQFSQDLTFVYGIQPTAEERAAVSGGSYAPMSGNFGMWYSWDGDVAWFISGGMPELFDFNLTYFPQVPGQPQTQVQKGNSITITRDSTHPEEAWEFIKFYMSDKAQFHLAEQGMYPATISAARQPFYQHPPAYPHIDMLPSAVGPERLAKWAYDVPGFVEAWNTTITPALGSVFNGEQDARVAVEGIADQVNAIIEQAIARVNGD